MSKSRTGLPLIALALLAMTACFKPLYDGPDAAGTIGPQGGTVKSADGTVTVIIPAGALSTPVTVGLTRASSNPVPPSAQILGSAWSLTPEGTHLSVPAQLSITLPQTPASGTAQVYAGLPGGVAVALATQVSGSTLQASISTFQDFAAAILILPSTAAGSGARTSTGPSSSSGTTVPTSRGSTGAASSVAATAAMGTTGGGVTGSQACNPAMTGATSGTIGSMPAICTLIAVGCDGDESWEVQCGEKFCQCTVDNVLVADVTVDTPADCQTAWNECHFPSGTAGGFTSGAGGSGGNGNTAAGGVGTIGSAANGANTSGTSSGSGTTGAICGVDVQCPGNETCELSQTICGANPTFAKGYAGACVPTVSCDGSCQGHPCSQDDDCPSAYICRNGSCQDLDCPATDPVCENGCLELYQPHTCQQECTCDFCPGEDAGPPTGLCNMLTACPPGQFCVYATEVCAGTDYSISASPNDNGMAGMGTCVAYKLCPNDDCSGLPCAADSDCSFNQTCANGVCKSLSCAGHTPCEQGCDLVGSLHSCEHTCICYQCP